MLPVAGTPFLPTAARKHMLAFSFSHKSVKPCLCKYGSLKLERKAYAAHVRTNYLPQEESSLVSLGSGAGVEATLGAGEATEPFGVTEGELLALVAIGRAKFCTVGNDAE